MQSELRALVSRTVTDAWQESGKTRLCFSNGAVLRIGWPHRLERSEAAGLAGQRLVSLSASATRIVLAFSQGASLLIRIEQDCPEDPAGVCLTTRRGRQVRWRDPLQQAAA